MRHLNLVILLSVAPSVAMAQAGVSGRAEATTAANASVGRTQASAGVEASAAASASAERPHSKPDSAGKGAGERNRALHRLSVEARAQAEATFERARRDSVPEHPLVSAMLEAQAKGATEAQILGTQQRALARLKAAHDALVRGGRQHPSDDEMHRGANLLARGATEVQLEKLAHRCPSERSLVVALETIAELHSRGVPVSTAAAQVGAQLEGRASDAAIRSLSTSLTTEATAGAQVGPSGIGAGAATTTSAGATAGTAVGGVTATGGLTGTIGGSLGR